MSQCVNRAALKGRADLVFDRRFCLMCGVFVVETEVCIMNGGAKWTRKCIVAGSSFHTCGRETRAYTLIDVFLLSLTVYCFKVTPMTSDNLYLQHPWQVSGTGPSHWVMAACCQHKESGHTLNFTTDSRNPTHLKRQHIIKHNNGATKISNLFGLSVWKCE